MRRITTMLCFLFALAPAASAHDTSDSDALAIYFTAMREQSKGIYELHIEYEAAPSAIERSGSQAAMRAGLSATIDHLASLDRRACFEELASAFDDYLDAIVDAYGTDVTPDERAGFLAQAAALGSTINGLTITAISECAPIR